jgi:hypothetical protein
MRRLILLAALASLCGCVNVRVASQPVCLPQVAYNADQEKAFGTALAALNPDNPLVTFVVDSIAMRQANKAVCDVMGGQSKPAAQKP